MSKSKTPSTSTPAQNDFGSNLWVKERPRHHNTVGRGLFAGLQDTKHYQVDSGWAKRDNAEQGIFGAMISRLLGGSYKPPTA